MRLRAILAVVVAAGFCVSYGFGVSAAADIYPDKPIRLIVPFPPGGGVDGAALALNDLLSGQVQMTFNPAVVIMPHVKTGRLRALAVTSAKRTPLVPELPTVAEAGVPGFEATGWYGLLGPRGLPPQIVAKLNRATLTVLGEREFVERYALLGIEPLGGTPAEFAAHIHSELAKWGKVVRESGARVD